MKSIALLLMLTVSVQSAFSAASQPGPFAETGTCQGTNELMRVRATYYNNALIPVVDLPIVEIIATKPGSQVFGARWNENDWMLLADLPEVEITGKYTDQHIVPAKKYGDGVLAEIDLPVIEVTSEFPVSNLVMAVQSEPVTEAIALVNLHEVTIYGDIVEVPLDAQSAVFLADAYSVSDNLKAKILGIYSNENSAIVSNMNAGWFLMSLEQCGVSAGKSLICNISSKISSYYFNRLK